MKESRLRNLVRQEIISKLDKMTEGEDPFVPTYGKGDVVHDCPKHVQETITGKRGKVTGHTLNESGAVNFVDVDFGTGKIFENIPTNKLKILEMQEHAHNIKEEPITGAGEEDVVTDTGVRYDSATAHPGISKRAYDSQQFNEDLKVKAKKDNEMGSSLGYRLTEPQHKKMLAFLKKNKSNADVKQLLATLKDKYSDSVSITLDNRPFFVYAQYGQLRIGSGGKVSQWNDGMRKALTKYIGESVLLEKVTPRQVSKAFSDISKLSMEMLENLHKYKAAKKSGNEANIKKYTKVAGTLSKQKRAMEAAMEKMITQLDKDVEYIGEGKLNEATKPFDTRFVREWEKMVAIVQKKMEEYKKNPTIKKTNSLYGMANGAYNYMNSVKPIPGQWLKIDKMLDDEKFRNEDVIGEGKLNEAPMDTRFQREWERNCKVLLTHLKHEQRGKLGAHKGTVKKMIDTLETVQQYPKLMGSLFGTNEGKLTEAKTRLDEKFGSRKLTSLFAGLSKNRWSTGREFLNSMASKHGIQWDKITDDQVKGPDKKLDRKGIDLIVATKDVEIPASSTYDWRTRITKGQLLSVTINGKRVWLGRGGVSTGGGKDRSFVGLDKRGYSNVRDVLNIDGAVVYHVDPSLKSRGGKDVRADRAAAKAGATAMMDAKKVKQDNLQRYRKALQIKAGKAGKGPIIKMLETATKMYEKALQEKLTKMKQGFIPRDSWYADTVKTIGHRYGYMIRAFEEYMRAGANIEAVKVKYKDDPDSAKYSISYEENTMASKAKEVKDEFNKLKSELSKLDKAKAYVDVKTLGRAY